MFPNTPEEAKEHLRSMPLALIVADLLMMQRNAAMVMNALKQSATPGSRLAGTVDDLERTMTAMVRNQMMPLHEYALESPGKLVRDA